jgi:3',5'-cyclic AMP phosphodiesterase CpdA
LHFGVVADVEQLLAAAALLPDLDPTAIVVTGDLTQRARHGEFLGARMYVERLERIAPIHVSPGNHDVQWWTRPLVPFGSRAKYAKYHRHFGQDLAPTLRAPGVVIACALTSHGVAWGSLTWNPRDIATKGHIPRAEVRRVGEIFQAAPRHAARVLVVHHNVVRGELSQRMGLARWRQAQRRLAAIGTELVLCGHDHQEVATTYEGSVVVSTTGTLSTRMRGGQPAVFNVIDIEPDRFVITFYRWSSEARSFQASDVHQFARHTTHEAEPTFSAVAP